MVRYKYWTKQAIFCYKRGAICKDCPIKKELETKCLMKKTIIELTRLFGEPKEEFKGLLPKVSYQQNRIINAILGGITTKEGLAKELNMLKGTVQSNLGRLYVIIEELGYRFKCKYSKLPELVEYIQENVKE